MITQKTIDRIRWHAGIPIKRDLDEGTVSSCTWPVSGPYTGLDDAISDLISTFASLNIEMNGAVPSEIVGPGKETQIPTTLAYAVSEIVGMLRVCDEAVQNNKIIKHALWQVETAWVQVLAGDIDDIWEDLKESEQFRSW